ncbi:MAG: starch-binding protein [Clostridia bacterium]|nr:starch-binding protein [Clostridia bacterium]
MKLSKKILSLILALIMVFSAFGVMLTVNAAAGDMFYFQKPADWNDDIYVYWWSGSGAPSWPGVKMTKEGGDIYSFKATTSFTEFNINDGGSESVSNPHQTVNLNFPKNGQLGTVGKSAGKNDYGNECWNLTWGSFDGIGVNAYASAESCDFIDSITVELTVIEAANGTYSINGGAETEFASGDKITIGKDGKVGDKFVLVLKAGEGADKIEKTYTYTKTDSPVGASIVYFDNSKFNWENVYCYAYGTKENGEWPGQAMSLDSKSGLYYLTFDDKYKSESIIFNDGQDGDLEGSQQYPEAGGLPLKSGQCKLLSDDLQWVDYGKPDSKPYGFAYIADGTKFSSDALNVDIDLKNAVKGSYAVDGGAEFEYTKRTTIAVGQGKIGNSEITLTLKAEGKDGTVTVTELTYYKTFKPAEVGFYSPTDGATTKAVGGNYATNPDMQLGKYSASIKVDGSPSDWDESMLIAQGVANDDPRVYMPSAIHERAVDTYALYASWDDDNLYFMWEMTNVSGVLGGDQIFSAQKPNGSIWNPGLPMYMLLSVDPEKHASGKARELDIKTNNWVESDSVWGSGLTFDTNIDTFIAFDSANTNGGAAIIPLDEEGFFNYTESVNIGRPTNDPGVLNRNGFEIAWDYGTLSEEIIGIDGYGGSREIGDTYSDSSDWVNFYDEGYDADDGFIYEIKVPLEHLGIDRNYIEQNGIGAMLVTTFGTSAMNTLPHDPSCLDNANKEYSYEPSTSHEKEDADNISVPLARVGALLKDTVVEEVPLELNFGADKSSAQSVGTELTLQAELYGTDEDYTVTFAVNGRGLETTENTASCSFMEVGTYELTATAKTKSGKEISKTIDYAIGEAVEVIIPPETEPDEPQLPTKPNVKPTEPVNPSAPSDSTDPIEGNTNPSQSGTEPSENTEPTSVTGTNPTVDNSDAPIIIPGTTSNEDNTTITFESLLIGDADDNGKVNVKDATLIQRYAAKLAELSEIGFKRSDVNEDNKVNVKDATAIQKYVARIEVPYPIGETIKK